MSQTPLATGVVGTCWVLDELSVLDPQPLKSRVVAQHMSKAQAIHNFRIFFVISLSFLFSYDTLPEQSPLPLEIFLSGL
jgi:hypothetical protein